MSLGRGVDSGAGGGFVGGCWPKVGSSSSLLLLCSSLLLFQVSLSSSLWLPLLLLSTKLSYLCSSFVEMLVVAAWEVAWMVVGGWGIPVTAAVLSSLQRFREGGKVKVTNQWCWQCWCVCLSLLFGFRASPFSPLLFLSRFLSSYPLTVTLFFSKLPSPFSSKRALSRPKNPPLCCWC